MILKFWFDGFCRIPVVFFYQCHLQNQEHTRLFYYYNYTNYCIRVKCSLVVHLVNAIFTWVLEFCSPSCWSGARVILRRTVVGGCLWHFNNLSGNHHQSEVFGFVSQQTLSLDSDGNEIKLYLLMIITSANLSGKIVFSTITTAQNMWSESKKHFNIYWWTVYDQLSTWHNWILHVTNSLKQLPCCQW